MKWTIRHHLRTTSLPGSERVSPQLPFFSYPRTLVFLGRMVKGCPFNLSPKIQPIAQPPPFKILSLALSQLSYNLMRFLSIWSGDLGASVELNADSGIASRALEEAGCERSLVALSFSTTDTSVRPEYSASPWVRSCQQTQIRASHLAPLFLCILTIHPNSMYSLFHSISLLEPVSCPFNMA